MSGSGPEVLWEGFVPWPAWEMRARVLDDEEATVLWNGQRLPDFDRYLCNHLARQLAASEAALAEARKENRENAAEFDRLLRDQREMAERRLAELPSLREGANQAAEMAFHLPVAGRLVDRFYLWQQQRKEEREQLERENADLRRRMAAALALVDARFSHLTRTELTTKLIELLTVEEGAKPEPAPAYRHPEAEANDKDGG